MAKYLHLFMTFSLGLCSAYCFAQETLSDPTRPLGYNTPESKAQSCTLTSIFKSETQVKAIVNGRLVKVGDTVNSGKIVAISETAVAVETKDGVQRLEMHRQIKRNSATQ